MRSEKGNGIYEGFVVYPITEFRRKQREHEAELGEVKLAERIPNPLRLRYTHYCTTINTA
jgi:hypothetical protein